MKEAAFAGEAAVEAAPAAPPEAGNAPTDPAAAPVARCPVHPPAEDTTACPVRPRAEVATGCPVRPTGGAPPCPVLPAGHISAEVRVRRLLRVPDGPPKVGDEAAQRLFSVSILLSALRCLLTYVALPILTPILGAAGGVGPAVGIPLALVALVFDVLGIRRFWLADHRWKWRVSAIYVVVMGFVTALLVIEVLKLAA